MYTLKYKEAVYQEYLAHADCWVWPNVEGLQYTIQHDVDVVSELYLGETCLFQRQGVHRLADTWWDISCILLEHNIFCEPIEFTDQLALPNMQETYDQG